MRKNLKLVSLFFFTLVAQAQTNHWQVPHWDIEMSGQEYQSIRAFSTKAQNGVFDPIVQMGKRNLDWLRFINSNRNTNISFSSAATQRGYPMDAPRIYNEAIVLQEFQNFSNNLPAAMRAVLLEGASFTKDLPLPEAEYLQWGLAADRVYQAANRWLMMQPYLWTLAWRKNKDVRGLYFLSHDENRDGNFANFSSLPKELQNKYREWLFEMCLNNGVVEATCYQNVDGAISSNSLHALYQKYLPASQQLWDSYFRVTADYPLALWHDNQMQVPFRQALDQDHARFLQDNIQDEWRFQDWQLNIAFGNRGIQVIWQAGITPHVPGLGSGTIYMDANQPLTEYDSQWTIRHEFGHVLGFPDCYVEFYDEAAGVIISYQLDITNLMCSRRGHLQEQHVSELRRVYSSAL